MSLGNQYYVDKKIFHREKQLFQDESWLLIAHNSQLKNNNNFINNASLDSLDLVLNEDKKVIENIQSNLESVISQSPIFGEEEFRINNFYNFFSSKI